MVKASAVVIFVIITMSIVVLTGWAGQVSLGQMSFVAFGAATGAYATQTWHLDLAIALRDGRPRRCRGGRGRRLARPAPARALPRRDHARLRHGDLERAAEPEVLRMGPQRAGRAAQAVRGHRPHVAAVATTTSAWPASPCWPCWRSAASADSRTGRVLLALRENERGAQSFGINVIRAKLTAFALSGFLAAFAGCLLVHLLQAVQPRRLRPRGELRGLHLRRGRRPGLDARARRSARSTCRAATGSCPARRWQQLAVRGRRAARAAGAARWAR